MTYDELIKEWLDPDVAFIKAHTSGSTGSPKSILLDKNLVESSALRTLRFFHISPQSLIHSCISPDFIGGKMAAIRACVARCGFSYEPPSNRPAIISEGVGKIWPDLISVVPSQMLHILENIHNIPEKTNFLVGGSAINPHLTRMIAESGINAWESYGMTETASHIALRRISSTPEPFLPLPGIGIRLNSRRCLCISLPNSDEIITNDIAEISHCEDGSNRFRILGRADNVIISGGKKIIPEEVENIISPLLTDLGVGTLMLTSEPDLKWGAATLLLLELPDSSFMTHEYEERLLLKVTEICTIHLPPHDRPKKIRIVPSLPRTSNGKLRRN